MAAKLDTTWALFYAAFQNTYTYDGVHIFKKATPDVHILGTSVICLKIKPTVGKSYRATRIAAQILGLPLDDTSRAHTISDDKTDLSRANLDVVAVGTTRYAVKNGQLVDRLTGVLINGTLNPISGYRQMAIYHGGKGHTTYVHRVLWELAHGPIPAGYVIDHKDGNRTNNVLSNLQMISMAHNGHKRSKAKGDYFGVSVRHYKNSTAYRAAISHNGYTNVVGCFSSPLYAAYAYDIAANAYYGTTPNNVKNQLGLYDRQLVEAFVAPKLNIRPKLAKPNHGYTGVNWAPRDGNPNYNAIITDVAGKTYTMGRYATADDAAYAANIGNEILNKKRKNVLPDSYEPSEAVLIAVDRGTARLISKEPRKNVLKAA